MAIILSVFLRGYRGKTVDFALASNSHRTTIAHFLNDGKWDDDQLKSILKTSIIEIVYSEARKSGQPVLCIVDDTIASHTKPSSQALHPIEAAYYHQSHLKGRQDYGHQVLAVMLACNGMVFNYAMVLYDKSKSKIQLVQEIADELPIAPIISYFLCDSWYTSVTVMESFLKKGFYTIGALRTNRILYPDGIRSKASEIAKTLKPSDTSLVTVGSREFYIWRYEGSLNGITNAVVLLSYPKNAFGQKQALRMFISTNVGLSTQEILDLYVKRWPIEVFFRNSKSKLALDTYQIRSQKGIERYWLIMSFTHYLCCICKGGYCSFEEGYQYLAQSVAIEHLEQLYKLSKSCSSFEAFSQATSGCFVHFSKFAHL